VPTEWVERGTVLLAAKRAGSIPGGRFVGTNGNAGDDERPYGQHLLDVLAGEGAIHLNGPATMACSCSMPMASRSS
jgi:hypothetical protein